MVARVFHWLLIALVFVLAVVVGLVVFAYATDKPYLTYKNLPFPPTVAKGHPGEVIPLHVIRCNSDNVVHSYTTTHSVEDVETHYSWILTQKEVYIAPGCTDSTSHVNRMPIELPGGRTYRIFGIASVEGVMGRKHRVEWSSMPFEVVK
jgi:hypothetical protein